MEQGTAPVDRVPPAALSPPGPDRPHIADGPRHPGPDDLRPRREGTPAGATAPAAPGRPYPVPAGRPRIFDPDVVERIAAGVAWSRFGERTTTTAVVRTDTWTFPGAMRLRLSDHPLPPAKISKSSDNITAG